MKLRRPFLIAALILAILVLIIELGTGFATGVLGLEDPPGLGIAYMALVDAILVFTLAQMTISLVVPERVTGRVQGCATLILAIVILLASIILIFVAITLLFLMIGLIASFFGAAIYLAVFGDFPRGAAAVLLSLLMTLKIIIAICLVIAHQRYLTNKGLVALIITTLVLNLVTAFLHDFPPGILVSITDAVAAIITAILAIIWGILLLIGAIVAIVRVIQAPSVAVGDESVSRGS